MFALSPLDGRYASRLGPLRAVFSEHGLIQHRIRVEASWLLSISKNLSARGPALTEPECAAVTEIMRGSLPEGIEARVKALEAVTNHDVKAVEYALKEHFGKLGMAEKAEWIHFALTSEDVNATAWAGMASEGRKLALDAMDKLAARLQGLAAEHAGRAMLSRTHGQPATPTTMGKEMANFGHRMRRHAQAVREVKLLAKMNGAVGTYSAHYAAFPDVDWPSVAAQAIEALEWGICQNPYTTQIEPHDCLAELFDGLARASTTVIGLSRDMWGYISLGYLKQRVVEGEVGSSTMPHKVNPIDFENAEGNAGLAIALLEHMARKLPISRFQRDLSDSTVMRNMGTAFAYFILAVDSLLRGLAKVDINHKALDADLDSNWEVLAEPIQTVMRRFAVKEPYEKLKSLTRGKTVTREGLALFLDGIDELPPDEKKRLSALTPHTYLGIASNQASSFAAATDNRK